MFKLTITLATGEKLVSTHATLAELDRARAEILADEAGDVAFCNEVRNAA